MSQVTAHVRCAGASSTAAHDEDGVPLRRWRVRRREDRRPERDASADHDRRGRREVTIGT